MQTACTHRLASLFDEEIRKLIGVAHVMVLDLHEQLLPLLHRGVSPFLERPLRRYDRVVDILLGSNWAVPKLFAGHRVCGTMVSRSANNARDTVRRGNAGCSLIGIKQCGATSCMSVVLTGALVLLFRIASLAINNVEEFVPFNGGDLAGRHDCSWDC